ncbi:MAG: DUF2281 domain-containing protein [Hymenobacter sp.]|nr:MAG: DUF2281 domain-containing protein [Hymenobacter sp.]
MASLPSHLQNEVKEFIATLKTKAQLQSGPHLLKRQFDSGKDFLKMSDGFDKPLEDVKEYM